MQLFFTMDELKLLVDVIEHCDRQLREQIAIEPEQATVLNQKRNGCARLLDRIVARDFGFGYDELEDMVEMLAGCRARFSAELTNATQVELKAALQKRNAILEHMLDKVTEACAMA